MKSLHMSSGVIQQWDKSATPYCGRAPVCLNSGSPSVRTSCLKSGSCMVSVNDKCMIKIRVNPPCGVLHHEGKT